KVMALAATDVPLTLKGFTSQTANILEVQPVGSTTPYVKIGPPVLDGTSATSNFLNVTGTLTGAGVAQGCGVYCDITSASGGSTPTAMLVRLNAGFVGGGFTSGAGFLNNTAGTGNTSLVFASGNWAVYGDMNSTTTGHNVGTGGSARGGNVNVGC